MTLYEHRTRCNLIGLLSIVVFAPLTAWSQESADSISTWQCLPAETAIAVRIPNGKAIADAFVQNTKFGAVIFSDERQEALVNELKKTAPEQWSQFHKWLAEFELTADELPQFFTGETGYAVVVVSDEDDAPLPLGLAWLQPGDELARRAYEIVGQAIGQQEDDEHPISREDLQLADCEVMQLMVPQIEMEYTQELELPDGFDELSEDEQDEAWDAAYEERMGSRETVVRYGTAMISTIAGRLVLVHSFETSEDRVEHPDSEQLADLLARLLEEHANGEGGFVAKHADDPVMIRARDLEGVVALELVGDSAALLRLARAASGIGETQEKVIRLLGVESLGPFVLRSALEGTLWQTQFSLSVPQPRQGLMRWCDQTPLNTEPPAWIPANAIAYNQISFDLGKAYAILKEEMLREFPDQVQKYFTMGETQVSSIAQVGIEELLGSLGNRHTVVAFGIELETAADVGSQPTERTAVVWNLQDEPVWAKLMQAAAPMARMMPGGEYTDEQGYSGFRFKNELLEGGLFLGNGNLVLAYGKEVLETTLSALNNPSEGARSFRGGDVYQKATTLLEPQPGLGYKVVDGDRQAVMLRDYFVEALDYENQFNGDEDEELADGLSWQSWMELAKDLLPSDEEIQGMFGVIVSRMEVDEHGLHGASVQELPPPDER